MNTILKYRQTFIIVVLCILLSFTMWDRYRDQKDLAASRELIYLQQQRIKEVTDLALGAAAGWDECENWRSGVHSL